MKKSLSLLCLAATMCGANVFAQTTNAAAAWPTDIAAACSLSKEINKPIYVFITDGSKECDKIQKTFLESDLFKNFAKDNLVLLRVDVPNVPKKDIPKQIEDILKKVSHKYPGMILMNHKEKCLAKITYKSPKTTSDYLFDLKEIIEKKGYAVDGASLEKYKPPTLRAPTRSTK